MLIYIELRTLYSIGHEVEVEYHPDATYSITVGGSGFLCSARLVKDKESYIIHGNLGDSFFTANVAIIDRTMHVFYGDHNYTVTLPVPDFFDNLGAKQVGGAKTPAYSSRVTKVSMYYKQYLEKIRQLNFANTSAIMNSTKVILYNA